CFAAVVLSFAFAFPLSNKTSVVGRAPLELPPEVLAYRAQELIKTIGYTGQPASKAHGFSCCDQQVIDRLQQYIPTKRDEILASPRPPVLRFWYRQHQQQMEASWPFLMPGTLTPDAPPNSEPGMIRVYLDAKGRLINLNVEPWETGSEGEQPDW